MEEIKDQRAAVLLALTDRTNVLTKTQLMVLVDCYKLVKGSDSPDKKKFRTYIARGASDASAANPEAFTMVAKPLLQALTLMVIRNGIDINVFTAPAYSEFEAAK